MLRLPKHDVLFNFQTRAKRATRTGAHKEAPVHALAWRSYCPTLKGDCGGVNGTLLSKRRGPSYLPLEPDAGRVELAAAAAQQQQQHAAILRVQQAVEVGDGEKLRGHEVDGH
jgi:hypothetical protein